MRLAIVGTRILACEGDATRVSERIYELLDDLWVDVVISGGAAGVDEIAENIARLAGYREDDRSLIIHRPTVKRWAGPGEYQDRNNRIVDDCTHLVRLSCEQGTTGGSAYTAARAAGLGKLLRDEVVCP